MSVFNDFQRMWMDRFPNSSLSDEWEKDVRASLTSHREKIVELTKEIEQENLYCDYLERLLTDVEKFRTQQQNTENDDNNSSSSATNGTGDSNTSLVSFYCIFFLFLFILLSKSD